MRTRARERVAKRLLERLGELSSDLRAAALFDSDGRQLASSDGADWGIGVAALWDAADRSSGEASQLHVGTERGELFAVRGEGGSIVATSERFALASLMLCDLRAVLGELESETSG